MHVSGIESRPALQCSPDTRAVGFALNANAAPTITPNGIDTILDLSRDEEIRFVVFDLRTTDYVHSRVITALVELSRKLQRAGRLLLVLDDNRTQLAALRDAQMTRYFLLLGSEAELTARLAELRLEFDFRLEQNLTQQDLDAALASGLTLDDLIEEMERVTP